MDPILSKTVDVTPERREITSADAHLWVLKEYIAKQATLVTAIISLKGGWERWLQAEWGLKFYDGGDINVMCEQPIWGTQERVDISIAKPAARSIGIELKCRTDSSQGTQFSDAFEADIKQVAKKPADTFCPCDLWAVGVSWVESDLTRKYKSPLGGKIYFDYVIEKDEKKIVILYMKVSHEKKLTVV